MDVDPLFNKTNFVAWISVAFKFEVTIENSLYETLESILKKSKNKVYV